MKKAFEGKVCVVTGAASGIGRAIAIMLAEAGAVVAMSDIDDAGLAETARMIGTAHANRVRADRLDVADADAVARYAPLVRESLGPADYVFNIAGLSRIGRFKDTPLASFEKVMSVNFYGVVRMSKAFLPQLLETKGGLVNISSLFGLVAVPGQSHYCASKFAVRGFSEALAAELEAEGVRVTCVHPGGVATRIARNAEVDRLPEDCATAEEAAAKFDKIAITSAEQAAADILAGAAKGARRLIVGRDARLVSFIQRLLPASYHALLRRLGGSSLA